MTTRGARTADYEEHDHYSLLNVYFQDGYVRAHNGDGAVKYSQRTEQALAIFRCVFIVAT